MFLHSSMTDKELIRSVYLCQSAYLRLIADRLEKRVNQLDALHQGLCTLDPYTSKPSELEDSLDNLKQLTQTHR
jgi:hypothetical protein